MQSIPRVALVGRPNVGKSTLFNRIIGGRHAVISDIAGTTRDRLERPVEYMGKTFILVDMAGLEPALNEKNEISQGMQRQVERALSDSAAIIWVVDAATGLTAADELSAELLRRQHKPVVVAANKADNEKQELGQYEFTRFGFESVTPISAIHARNVDDLLQALVEVLPDDIPVIEKDERELRLAIVGRPNVGKSTLLNAITHDFRAVTSPIAGTTRDAVDEVVSAEEVFGSTFTKWNTVRLIDTAGIRRRGKIDRSIEGWSVLRSYAAIDAAEVVLFVIDATEKLVHQDLQVANRVVDAGRALVLVVNKWDAILTAKGIVPGTPEDDEEQSKFLDGLRAQMPFMPWVQVLFLSALMGTNVHVLGKLVLNAYIAWSQDIDQADLDELSEQLKRMPRLKNLRRITYEHAQPPVFFIHVHGEHLPHFSTNRYVENALRDFFKIGPTPIKIWTKTQSTRQRKKEEAAE